MNPDTAVADPDALAAGLGSRVEEATKRLEQTAAETTDDQARAPSRLPDWSRGHVLTHLARNADGLRNLLVWARTGVETPQYPSVQARNNGIKAGAGRSAAELAADIAESAAQFAAEAARLSGADWTVQVAGVRGGQWTPGLVHPLARAVRSGDPPRRPGPRLPAGGLARAVLQPVPGLGG